MTDIFYKDESYNIIGKCMEVHNELGRDFWKSFIKMHWNMNSIRRIFHTRGKNGTK